MTLAKVEVRTTSATSQSGVAFGVANTSSGNFDQTQFTNQETAFGRHLDFSHKFFDFSTFTGLGTDATWGVQRTPNPTYVIPNIGGKTGGSTDFPLYDNTQASPGQAGLNAIATTTTYDAVITQWANALKAVPGPVLVRLWREPNLTTVPWYTSTPATYRLAWQKVYNLFQTAGATNVEFLWTAAQAGTANSGVPGLNWYPGNAYVDWIGCTGYRVSPSYATFSDLFTPFYTEFSKALYSGKPILLEGAPDPTTITVTNTNAYRDVVKDVANAGVSAPLAYYRLNNNPATNLDASGFATMTDEMAHVTGSLRGFGAANGLPTGFGAASLIPSDTTDKSINFDGNNDMGQANSLAGYPASWPAITIEFWVDITRASPQGEQHMVHFSQASGGHAPGIFHNKGAPGDNAIKFSDGTNFAVSDGVYTGTTNAGVHHVVGTVDSSNTIRLYIDGVKQSVPANKMSMRPPANGFFTIGCDHDAGAGGPVLASFYQGRIDEVAIYNIALSDAQIANHYSVGQNGGGGSSSTAAGWLSAAVGILKNMPLVKGFILTDQTATPVSSITGATAGVIAAAQAMGTDAYMQNMDPLGSGSSATAWQQASGLGTWQYALDSTALTNGLHTIEARATDAANNQSPIAAVTVTVDNSVEPPQGPTVSVTDPANGRTNLGSGAYTAKAVVTPLAGTTLAASNPVQMRLNGGSYVNATNTVSANGRVAKYGARPTVFDAVVPTDGGLSAVINAAAAGDVIKILDGNYTMSNPWGNAANLTLMGETPAQTIAIDGTLTWNAGTGVHITNTGASIIDDAVGGAAFSGMTFMDIDFSGASRTASGAQGAGRGFSQGNNNQFLYCKIRDCDVAGMGGGPSNLLLDHCHFRHNGFNATAVNNGNIKSVHGYQAYACLFENATGGNVWMDCSGPAWVVAYCEIRGATKYGIHHEISGNGSWNAPAGLGWSATTFARSQFHHNYVYGNNIGGGKAGIGIVDSRYADVYQNVVHDNNGRNIVLLNDKDAIGTGGQGSFGGCRPNGVPCDHINVHNNNSYNNGGNPAVITTINQNTGGYNANDIQLSSNTDTSVSPPHPGEMDVAGPTNEWTHSFTLPANTACQIDVQATDSNGNVGTASTSFHT